MKFLYFFRINAYRTGMFYCFVQNFLFIKKTEWLSTSRKNLQALKKIISCRGLQRDVVYLGWPIAPKYGTYMSPNAGGGLELRGSEYSCTQDCDRSPKILWRFNSIFNQQVFGRMEVLPTVQGTVTMFSYYCTCRKHIAQDTGFAFHNWTLISVFIAHSFGGLLI